MSAVRRGCWHGLRPACSPLRPLFFFYNAARADTDRAHPRACRDLAYGRMPSLIVTVVISHSEIHLKRRNKLYLP